ncbi:IPTL-CTERM sorting domain-containing protein [Paracidovorax valerianellae]|uniref:IPTL-CTERM protein sorting domain-containing protein n=1 Tax=Paracidovorax valerianellae TaxID=187868 RepID=A0A1G7E9I5_9BURK|nr:IPTL-CTERM sorting domain-containing protein [Paracidovorax valerianellae]MDA8447420.1 IPTL-CTERM sorting domain-containing protein [Paracidovorax valerianellae]SDE60394.1 IPTL-CTERM protein sorting domain-containing protein [Paracidovorax valerianellae]
MKNWFQTLALCALLAPAVASAATVVSCPANTDTGGDGLSRSFYLPNYSTGTLDTVTVNYHATVTGSYNVALEARLNAFNGTLVSTANATATVTTGTAGGTPVTFNFGNAAIPANSTITFKQTLLSGPGGLSVNTGQPPCTGTVEQTNGSTPPLDSNRRATLAITVTGNAAAGGGGGAVAAPASIPTLSEWGLILMSALVAAFGFVHTRRRLQG